MAKSSGGGYNNTINNLTNNVDSATLANVTAALNGASAPSAPAATTSPTYQFGSRGDGVKSYQNILKNKGFLYGTPDGVFGNKTRDAIIKFQARNGLTQTGVIDQATMNALNGAMSTPSNTTANSNSEIVLGQYLSVQGGIWPPVIQNTSVVYRCTQSKGSGDVPTSVIQKVINGRTYCITSSVDGAMGSMRGEYTYTTPSDLGTKTTHFTLNWSTCGVYGTTGDPVYDKCKSYTSGISNLDTIVDGFFAKTINNGTSSASNQVGTNDMFTISSVTTGLQNWNTYTNSRGFSFQYPSTWSQVGKESEAVCDIYTGATCITMVDFIDTASKGIESSDGNNNKIGLPKDKLHVEYHFDSKGVQLYSYALYNDYNNSQNIYAQNKRTISVAGQTALVGETKQIPSHSEDVLFLDKNHTGAFEFQFTTPLNGNDVTEIANFEQLLKTFKN